ncbi:MAG: insulinase family protein [Gammaproteobacteria bacterium]|nr:insulinase family protein [Gammaproteobacteria bacterium]
MKMRVKLWTCLWILLLLSAGFKTAFSAPTIQQWQTKNGVNVLYVPVTQLPMVDIRIVFDAGSARDEGKAGLARLTSNLLMTGAGQWDAGQIANRLESVGARLSTGARTDMAWLSLRSLVNSGPLEQALSVLESILVTPTFAETEVARLKKQMLIALDNIEQSPDQVAQRAFMAAMYDNHPYGSPKEGTPESVEGLTRKAVVDFFNQFYVAQNAVVAIVGDVSRAEAEALVERLMGRMKTGEPALSLPEVSPLKAAKTTHIPFPSTQSTVLIGQPGMARGADDYFPLYLGNHIFGGGGFSSILMTEIREKRGLVYSVYSYFIPMAEDGPYTIGLQTRHTQVETALNIVHDNLKRFIEEGPSETQLQASKLNITGSEPLRTDSNRKIVEYLAMMGFYRLPLDYLETFSEKIRGVSQADIQKAFQRKIQADKLVTVVVGGEKAPSP